MRNVFLMEEDDATMIDTTMMISELTYFNLIARWSCRWILFAWLYRYWGLFYTYLPFVLVIPNLPSVYYFPIDRCNTSLIWIIVTVFKIALWLFYLCASLNIMAHSTQHTAAHSNKNWLSHTLTTTYHIFCIRIYVSYFIPPLES